VYIINDRCNYLRKIKSFREFTRGYFWGIRPIIRKPHIICAVILVNPCFIHVHDIIPCFPKRFDLSQIITPMRPCNSNRSKERANILADFDHCVIKRAIHGLYSRTIAPTVSIIHKEIKDSRPGGSSIKYIYSHPKNDNKLGPKYKISSELEYIKRHLKLWMCLTLQCTVL
jgi:hypothetical protein